MDTRPDEISDFERRLAALAPAEDGLAVEAVLFAAGRASVRPRATRFAWPIAAAVLALLSSGLEGLLVSERHRHLALVEQLHAAADRASVAATPARPIVTVDADELASDSLIASHRISDTDLEHWPLGGGDTGGADAPAVDTATSRARQIRSWIEQ